MNLHNNYIKIKLTRFWNGNMNAGIIVTNILMSTVMIFTMRSVSTTSHNSSHTSSSVYPGNMTTFGKSLPCPNRKCTITIQLDVKTNSLSNASILRFICFPCSLEEVSKKMLR